MLEEFIGKKVEMVVALGIYPAYTTRTGIYQGVLTNIDDKYCMMRIEEKKVERKLLINRTYITIVKELPE